MSRRKVRATPALFWDVDRLLPADVRSDFTAHELLPVIDTFAERWDHLPLLYPDLPDFRVVATRGLVVPWLIVVGRLVDDGAIELIALDVER